jgi:hypothetical protein
VFDINGNQKELNSSHLAIMQSKLTPEQLEIDPDHLDRWIAKRDAYNRPTNCRRKKFFAKNSGAGGKEAHEKRLLARTG